MPSLGRWVSHSTPDKASKRSLVHVVVEKLVQETSICLVEPDVVLRDRVVPCRRQRLVRAVVVLQAETISARSFQTIRRGLTYGDCLQEAGHA